MISFRFRYFAVEAILQRWRIVFDLSKTGSGGQWAGMAILRSKVAPCDCGRRETTRDVLTLNYEDDMYSKFHYYVEGNSMTLTTERGENQLWNSG